MDDPATAPFDSTPFDTAPVDGLWPIGRVARYWGVSESRARARLADRGIKRVSGYPASAVRADTTRQGRRSDLREGRLVRTENLLILANPAVLQPAEHWRDMLEYLLGTRLEDDELAAASQVCASALRERYPWLRAPEETMAEAAIRSWVLRVLLDHKETQRVPPLPPDTWDNHAPRVRWTAEMIKNQMG